MKSFAPLATLLFAASAFAQSSLTINTPYVFLLSLPLPPLTLSLASAPLYANPFSSAGAEEPPPTSWLLPGNDPSGNTVLDFGQLSGTSLTWTVNVTVGTSLGLTLTDSTGAIAQSAAFTVQTSSDQSCLNAKTTAAGSSGAAGSTAAATTAAATTAAATTAAATTPVTSATTPATSAKASSAASSAASAAASTTAKASSAATQKASFALVGALGAAALALLA